MASTVAATKQVIMSDMFTAENDVALRRFKVSTVTRQEILIARGDFFVGNSERVNVPVGDVHYSIVIAPIDKFLIIEDVIQDVSFSAVSDGKFTQKMDAFIDGSITSNFSYTPNAPTPIGRAMISSSINGFPGSTADIGIPVGDVTVTGTPEYGLTFSEFYIDNSGNRNVVSQTASSFFDKGRQLILAPGAVALVRATTTGDATGTADVRTTFFTSELSIDEAPTLLGINP